MVSEDEESNEDGLATVAGGAGLVFGGRVVKLVFGFASHIIMAQLLGVGSYGGVIVVNISMGFAALMATMGLRGGLERNVPYFEDDVRKARGVVKAAGQLAAVSSVLVAGVAILVAPEVATRIFDDPEITLLLQIAAVGLPFEVLRKISISTTKGARDARTHVVVKQILHPVANASFIAALVLADFGAAGAVAGSVAAKALTGVVAAYLMLRTLPFSLRGPTTRMHRRLLVFSLPLMLSAGMNLFVFQVDTLLVGALGAAAAAGLYNVAFRFRSLGMFFFFPLSFLLPPVLTRLAKQGEDREAQRIYQVTSKWMVLATLPLIVGMVLFPEVIIRTFFGTEYLDAANVLRLLMVPVLVTVVLGANGRALVALGHNRVNMWVNGGAAVANVGLNLALIPPLGIFGAALASATALIGRDLAFSAILYRREGLYAPSRAMLQSMVAGIALAAGGYLLVDPLVEFTLVTALGWGAAYLVAFAGVAVLSGAIESEDERMVSLVEDRAGVEFRSIREIISIINR